MSDCKHELQLRLEELTQALRTSESRFRNVITRSSDGIVIVDEKGIITFANPAALDLFDRTGDKLLGESFGLPIVSGETTELDIVRNGRNAIVEMRVADTEWDERPARVLTLRDITERRRTENELRKMHRAVQDSPNMVIITDPHGVIEFVNQRFTDMTGYTLEEVEGEYPDFLRPERVPSEFCDEIREAIQRRNVWRGELTGTRKNGEPYWESIAIAPVMNLDGDVTNFVSISVDITHRKRSEDALKAAHDELEKRVQERTAEIYEKNKILLLQGRQAAMGEMISNIAHQWRQPLNSLGLITQQLLLYYDLGEFTREYLETRVKQSMGLIHHMSGTIDDFRNYFRPDKDKGNFKVSEAIENTLSLIGDSFRNQNISVEVSLVNDALIHGYRNEFAQVLLNILNNAMDALQERETNDRRVIITIKTEGGWSVVTIADNAGGIPEGIIDKIFDPYFTTKGPQTGTGIGLFMSKTIIEKNMGGKLEVRNLAAGAEFRIELSTGN